jgi:hypothetical protein
VLGIAVDAVDVPVAELAPKEELPICARRTGKKTPEMTAGIRRGSNRPERRRRHTNQADDTNNTSKRLVRNKTSSTDISERQGLLHSIFNA